MGSPGIGGSISAASDVALNNPTQDDLMLRDGGYWKNIPANSKIAGIVNAVGATRSALDTRYIRTVNGSVPDASGNVTVNTGSAGVTSVNTRTGAVTLAKSDVGLANVDNTSDVSKPVSTATQTALNAKANTTHVHAIADLPSGMVLYTSTTTRPTARTDIMVIFTGADPGSNALSGDEWRPLV